MIKPCGRKITIIFLRIILRIKEVFNVVKGDAVAGAVGLGEKEKGRKGEKEKREKGEGEKGRKGEKEKGERRFHRRVI